MYFENYDLSSVVTPINIDRLRNLLVETGYNVQKRDFSIQGFTAGFNLGYEGPCDRQDTSNNLPFHGVGNSTELWNKVMKEIQMKRYASPFKKIPYDAYMQSPIGLVPKGDHQTRLIFHLSYDLTTTRQRRYVK